MVRIRSVLEVRSGRGFGTPAMTCSDYEHVERLSESAWATLYRAVRHSDGHSVLHAQGAGSGAALLAKQLEFGGTLDSAFILRPLSLSTFEGSAALELEDSDGLPLEHMLGTALEIEAFIDLALRVTSAVAGLHGSGVVHGALMPRCILVGRETSSVKLFGFWHSQRETPHGMGQRPGLLIEDCLPYVSPSRPGARIAVSIGVPTCIRSASCSSNFSADGGPSKPRAPRDCSTISTSVRLHCAQPVRSRRSRSGASTFAPRSGCRRSCTAVTASAARFWSRSNARRAGEVRGSC